MQQDGWSVVAKVISSQTLGGGGRSSARARAKVEMKRTTTTLPVEEEKLKIGETAPPPLLVVVVVTRSGHQAFPAASSRVEKFCGTFVLRFFSDDAKVVRK